MYALFKVCRTFVAIYSLVYVISAGSNKTTLSLHPQIDAMDDVSRIKWAHAVNSREALEDALTGNVDFLEADISMGHVVGNGLADLIPIMAHPPEEISDISVEHWLHLVIARNTGKGIKLDFKQIDTVEPTLQILRKHSRKVNFPVWLNADILPGPVNSKTFPVTPRDFLRLSSNFCKNATLSVGWTTYWFDTFPPDTWYYGWNHVRAMVDTLRCSGLEDNDLKRLTFPVRAIFACRSISQLQWLLDVLPSSTLTVWSSKSDSVDPEDLLKIRESFEISSVYYDVPEKLSIPFYSRKDQAKTRKMPNRGLLGEWTVFKNNTKNSSCSSNVYTTPTTVMFGNGTDVSVISRNSFLISDNKRLQIEGCVSFFTADDDGTLSSTPGSHEVALVLGDNLSSVNDILWNDINSIRLHVFQQNFSALPWSCHYFKLDTKEDETFQAWSFPCELLLDGLPKTELEKFGKRQVPHNMRLVVPPGPVTFGFISSGNGYAVIHDLEVKGEKFVISGSEPLHLFTKAFALVIALTILFISTS